MIIGNARSLDSPFIYEILFFISVVAYPRTTCWNCDGPKQPTTRSQSLLYCHDVNTGYVLRLQSDEWPGLTGRQPTQSHRLIGGSQAPPLG